MASDLETNLINGGLTPAAAKILANALANVASPRTDIGRRYGDATPVQQLRMVTPEARKYMLTNLDQPRDGAFPRLYASPDGTYSPRDTSHSYAASQPATSGPTLTVPTVAEGSYVSTSQVTKDSVAQSKVGLRVSERGGQHARFNPATQSIESVPFLVENDQEQFIEAKFEERADATVLKLRLRNLDKLFTVTTSHPSLVSGTFSATNEGVSLNITLNGITALTDSAARPFWAWNR